jgi:O-methyltransferase
MATRLEFESEEFYELSSRMDFFRRAARALRFNEIQGDYAEFGCWSANTFRLAYVCFRRYQLRGHLWACDSFEGLPTPQEPEDEKWIGGAYRFSIDEFKRECSQQNIPATDFTIVKGFYDETLKGKPLRTPGLPDNISLAYIDCDMLGSTRAVLDFLEPRLKHGMIIALDDYYCWTPKAVSGNRLALLEFSEKCRAFHFLPFIQFGWNGMSFVVEERAHLEQRGLARRPTLGH